ncbi:MAG: hypothetical protein HGB36_09630 [Chlorobiaceae bacterium]|nr:hypothetical protein [Chlorobiaceae bacterium]
MSKLHPTKDARTRYDKKNNAVRSFFGTELVEKSRKALKKGVDKFDEFLDENQDVFKLEGITLEKTEERAGSTLSAVRYNQKHNGLPVYNAFLNISVRKSDNQVLSAVNKIDYELAKTCSAKAAKLDADDAVKFMHDRFDTTFGSLEHSAPELFVYRHSILESPQVPFDTDDIRNKMLESGSGKAGKVYLVWRIMMDTAKPTGYWELLVNAEKAELVAVKDRRRFLTTRKANIYWPDPITSSQNTSLSWSSAESTLNNELEEVDLENLNDPSGSTYHLSGQWVNSAEREDPSFAPPTTTTDFKYTGKSRNLLSVMAYFYIDRVVEWLRTFSVPSFNNSMTGPIDVDAQAFNGDDNSHFVVPNSGNPFIGYGEGGTPDACDPGVILHEFGHALHHYVLGASNSNSSFEEGFNDFLSCVFRDRYNEHQFDRANVFPWDNNSTVAWSDYRRCDLAARFDDSGYSSYGFYKKGNVYATALWDIYLNIGGGSSNSGVRLWAAGEIMHTYLEMLVAVGDNEPVLDLANGLIAADEARTGGLYKKVIWDAFRRRGLWSNFTPQGNADPYITDSGTDAGEQASPDIHWTSPDIWVRNNPPDAPGENPDDGHQNPIKGVSNYLYILVRNRGSQTADNLTVEAFYCDPATGMLWPNHFNSMGMLTVTGSIPAGGNTRVGPFIWNPQHLDHECLLAIVRSLDDLSIVDSVIGPVDHWKIVRFDNNVGQRNVSPVNAMPGGKTKTSIIIRGSNHLTTNDLSIDAKALPSDTGIEVKVARSIVDNAAEISSFTKKKKSERTSLLTMSGGHEGLIRQFPLSTNAESTITITVDFSINAEHLKVYPVIVSQFQDGQLAGRYTIEITAVKEAEDWVYGNRNTKELHRYNCEFFKKMNRRNAVPFARASDGIIRGYNGCIYCMKEIDSDHL